MKIIASIKNALGSARKDIEGTRDQIADLKAKRATIDAAPVDRAESERRADYEMQRAIAERLPPRFSGLVERDRKFFSSDFDTVFQRSPFAMLSAIFPDEMRAFLLGNLPSNGTTNAERDKRIAAIDQQILTLEKSEEAALRAIEAATGATMPRRPDASPEVLLAGDDALPS